MSGTSAMAVVDLVGLGAIPLPSAGLPPLPRGLWIAHWFRALLLVWHTMPNLAHRVGSLRATLARGAGDQQPREAARQRYGLGAVLPLADAP